MPAASARRLDLRSCAVWNVVLYLCAAAVLFALILRRTQGHFTYCLDDPYIHLALAERIRHGFYGLNAGEAASPSSSLLWPLLFVPFAGTRVMAYLPLVFNLGFGALSAWLLGRFVDRFAAAGDGRWRSRLLAVLLVVSTSLLGLTFTGLEQALEVMLAIAAAFALVHVLEGERVPWWSIAAAAVLPSVRYEGVLLTFAVAVALWAVRARRGAVLLMTASVVPLLGFGLFLRHLGLPFEPMSVLVKASYKFADQGSALPVRVARLIVDTLLTTLQDPERFGVFLLTIAAGYLAWRSRQTRSTFMTLCGAVVVGLVQVFLGPFGWFYRYEMYCTAFLLVVVLAAAFRLQSAARLGRTDSDLGTRSRPDLLMSSPYVRAEALVATVRIPGSVLLLVSALAMFYAKGQLGISQASLGIHEEQAQLARLSHEFYQGPVAVNDLGLVSFGRSPDEYVLDLVGLGSYEAFKVKEADRTPAWLDSVTREHGIGLVMIYPEWFKHGVPAEWFPVAKLCAAHANPEFAIYSPRVMLYATAVGDRAALERALAAFRVGLPQGTALEMPVVDGSAVCR